MHTMHDTLVCRWCATALQRLCYAPRTSFLWCLLLLLFLVPRITDSAQCIWTVPEHPLKIFPQLNSKPLPFPRPTCAKSPAA
jgi:hypothetical protein